MEVKVLEDEKKKLVLEIKGETATLVAPLKKELYNDTNVKAAGFNVPHPLINESKLILETKSKEPRKVLKDAIKRLKKTLDSLESEAKKLK